MEREIGEVFKFQNTKLQVVETKRLKRWNCRGCYFYDTNLYCLNYRNYPGYCFGDFRKDKKDVIFKEVKYTLLEKLYSSLPLYIDLNTFKIIPITKQKGYTLAIWNCGDSKSLWSILRNLRITIRKDGKLYKVIKHGYVL